MTIVDLRPIETLYRGFRFRSRLEARWAVFFDAAGIEWEYEPEGYSVGGVNYLPDFWLPQLQAFVEARPTEEACQKTIPVMHKLVRATGHRGVFAIGAPNLVEPPTLLECRHFFHGVELPRSWRQCLLCDCLFLYDGNCNCCSDASVQKFYHHDVPSPRLQHALGEAQRARFEHGEDGTPRPYDLRVTEPARVYVAGSVLESVSSSFIDEAGQEQEIEDARILPWRTQLFQADDDALQAGKASIGRFIYAGPTILESHGQCQHGLGEDCLNQVLRADVLFAWIDREDTIGTLAEIGAASAQRKPIFIAFANRDLAEHFYFAQHLSWVTVVTPSVSFAWKLFVRWHDRLSAGEEVYS
jgi:hypothetical protein